MKTGLIRAFHIVLYFLLLSVVVSCLSSVWIGLMDVARYQAEFPGAKGLLYWLTLFASSAAAVIAIFIFFRKGWAVIVNPFVGMGSILLLELVHAPRLNQIVILVATVLTTLMPWYLWFRKPRETGDTAPN